MIVHLEAEAARKAAEAREVARAVEALAASTTLAPSEALAVVRRARLLDGDVIANLADACDLLAVDFDDRAVVHRYAGTVLRRVDAGGLVELERVADRARGTA